MKEQIHIIEEALAYYANGADFDDDINTEIAKDALTALQQIKEGLESECSHPDKTISRLHENGAEIKCRTCGKHLEYTT